MFGYVIDPLVCANIGDSPNPSKYIVVVCCSIAVATISNSAQHPQDKFCFTKGADIGQLPGIASRWSVTCCPENDWKRRAENSSGFRRYWSRNFVNNPLKKVFHLFLTFTELQLFLKLGGSKLGCAFHTCGISHASCRRVPLYVFFWQGIEDWHLWHS